MKNRDLVFAVDLDRTILRHDRWKGIECFGEPLEGARDFLKELSKYGHIVIHSCRCTSGVVNPSMDSEDLARIVEDYLIEKDLKYDEVWYSPGKPNADIFIDDKGFRMTEHPSRDNYEEALKQIKEILNV